MTRYLFSILFLTFFSSLFGQKEFFIPRLDSIKMSYRSGGNPLDLVDRNFIGHVNLRPGAGFETIYEENLADEIFDYTGGLYYKGEKHPVLPKYSGIPYFGFKYAFGTATTQDINLEYHQFYSPYTQLHLRYRRQTTKGFLRNGNYKLNDLNIHLYHSKNWYSTNFNGYYGNYDMGQNGGIQTDSLLDELDLIYTPVNTESAQSKVRKLNLKWDNYFRLIGDSAISTGLTTHHQLLITNREYLNSALDPSLFDTLYLNANQTADQYQNAELSNGVGVYFNSPYFKVDGTLNYKLRKFQNRGIGTRDTSEAFLYSHLWASLGKKIILKNNLYFNLLGALGEMKDKVQVHYFPIPSLTIEGALNFENLYPVPFQRRYTSNYYQWDILNLELQQKLQVSGGAKWGDTNFVAANVVWSTVNNGRYFIDNQWRQDTLNTISVGSFVISGGIHFWKFSFYPRVAIHFNTNNFNYQPSFTTMNRLAFTTKLFKAKLLGVSLGVDVGYQTSYHPLTYNGVLGVMEVSTTDQTVLPGHLRLNAFFAISIDRFRLFIRVQDISSAFLDPTMRIDPNFPIMPMHFRLGITWDFFN